MAFVCMLTPHAKVTEIINLIRPYYQIQTCVDTYMNLFSLINIYIYKCKYTVDLAAHCLFLRPATPRNKHDILMLELLS